MKKLVFAFCMMFGAVVVVNAQDSTSTSSPSDPSATQQPSTDAQQQPSTGYIGTQDEGRVKIKSQELPDEVKSSLESQEYRGWLVSSAYKMDASASATQSGSTQSSSTSTDTTGVSSSGNAGTATADGEVYIVELKNGAQTKTVKFGKDGKRLDDEGMNEQKK